MIRGARVNLRKIEYQDIPIIVKWMQDEIFSYYLYGLQLDPYIKVQKRITEIIEDNSFSHYKRNIYFMIETKSKVSIGLVMFTNIDWKSRNLMMNVIIGEKEYRDNVYGVDSYLISAGFAFEELNMHKINGYINEYNRKAIRISKSGYSRKEGILRKHLYKKGRYFDLYLYSLFKKDFSRVLTKLKELNMFEYWRESELSGWV